MRQVLSTNSGTTFLPALLSLSWMEDSTTDGLLLRLIPPCLQELELTIAWQTPSEQVHRLLTGLSHPVLSLRTVRINGLQPEQILLDPLLNVTSIRNLSIKGNIVLGAGMLYKIFSDLALVSIEVTVRDLKACQNEYIAATWRSSIAQERAQTSPPWLPTSTPRTLRRRI